MHSVSDATVKNRMQRTLFVFEKFRETIRFVAYRNRCLLVGAMGAVGWPRYYATSL